jgi:acetyltransferase-like isoleucine patch superfamily enzyme
MKKIFIHPTALIETKKIGQGTKIWAFTHIMPGASIGKNCNIGDHCFIEGGTYVGDNTTIKNGNMIWEGVTLEEGVFVGPHVFFTNDLYPRSRRFIQTTKRYQKKDNWLMLTLVKKGASLGAGVVILAGITIGEYAMVGASAVVTKNVLPYELVVGNPAKRMGWVCQCGNVLKFKKDTLTCSECRNRYKISNNKIKFLKENA